MVRIIIRVIKGLFQCYNDLYGFDWILQIFSKAKAFSFCAPCSRIYYGGTP